ncbi:MAG: spore coat U domain-containing protein [Pseudomonadota bacterium]
MLTIVRVLTSLLLAFICQNAMGAMATGTLAVTANVGGATNCVLGGVKNIIFPNYSPLASNPDYATGSITVSCVDNLPYDVGISKGQSADATETQRMLVRIGGGQLHYALFQEGNHVHNYGTIIGQNTLHQLGTGLPQVITVYGEIPINQQVEVGPYSDTVTIIVTF